jgi:hypothetical protein
MPVARGIMQIGRINIYPTITTISNIDSISPAMCGDPITFTITVANERGTPVPTGTVYLMDRQTPIGSGALSAGTTTITIPLNTGNLQLHAFYPGIVNLFGASNSSPIIPYDVYPIETQTTVLHTDDAYFCSNLEYELHAHVELIYGIATPTGNVIFNIYFNDVDYITIGTASLDSSGNASIIMPANTVLPNNLYYIHAFYLGDGCYGESESPPGETGKRVNSLECIIDM